MRTPRPARGSLRPSAALLAALLAACGGQSVIAAPDAGDAARTDVTVDVAAMDAPPDAPTPDAPPPVDAPPDIAPPVDAPPDVACPREQTRCGEACVNTATSAAHCGTCGRACPAGQVCAAGECRVECAAPLVPCASGGTMSCVDPRSDAMNCGGCGRACPAGQVCTAGACACPSGRSLCGAACVDVQTDPAHCGACDAACRAGHACVEGACRVVCAPGRTVCVVGGMMTCVDATTDPANCGVCGRSCPGSATCTAGACTCPAGQTLCAGACVDARSSTAHCGACGRACTPPAGGVAACTAGECAAPSCRAIRAANPAAPNGVYTIDLDGPGIAPARPMYCDMTGGGWTLIMNQAVGMLLPDVMTTVNPSSFGSLTQSYRLGNPDVTLIRPAVAWKLTDATNSVYFRPTCVVDWSRNYGDLMMTPTDCTRGYTDTTFATMTNGAWVWVSARGIGINNGGAFCSIRAYEAERDSAGNVLPGARPAGLAAPCEYRDANQRVALWFL